MEGTGKKRAPLERERGVGQKEKARLAFVGTIEAGADRELRELIETLRRRDFEVEVRIAWEKGQAEEYARRAGEEGVDAVVACGGDGTLFEVINGVVGLSRAPMVAGLPFGTGNDFLRSLGIEPSQGSMEFLSWLNREPTRIDLGRLGERYFLNMATAGVGAEITTETSREFKNLAGRLAYLAGALPKILDRRSTIARIEARDFVWEGELAFLFIGNGIQAGGGWQISPAARLNDGLLDLVVVPEASLPELLRGRQAIVESEAPGDYGEIRYRQIPRVMIEWEEPLAMNLDGEPVEVGTRVEVEVVSEAISFLIP